MVMIGFLFLICILFFLTFGMVFVLLHGGEEFSPAPFCYWFLILPIGAVWWIVLKNAPFTVIIN
jgi:hypothetical protein